MSLFSLPCPGMRADNPLGFMSAIGFLRALDAEWPALAPKLAWQNGHAVFFAEAPGLPACWASQLADVLKKQKNALLPDRPIIKTDIATFRREARARLATAHTTPTGWTRLAADLQAGLATDALPPEKGKVHEVSVTRLNLTAGGKQLLKMIGELIDKTDAGLIIRAALGQYDASLDSKLPTTRWDPSENQQYAYRALDPDGAEKTTPRGLQVFAYIGLSALPVFAQVKFAATTAVILFENEAGDREPMFRWQEWSNPMAAAEVSLIVAHPGASFPSGQLAWESRRMKVGDQGNVFFSPAVAVPLR